MFLFLAIVVTTFVVMFAQYNQIDLDLGMMYTSLKFHMSFFSASMLTFSLGIVTGVLIMIRALIKTSFESARVSRQLERTSVGADDSELRVKTLENKIATLEAALKKALSED